MTAEYSARVVPAGYALQIKRNEMPRTLTWWEKLFGIRPSTEWMTVYHHAPRQQIESFIRDSPFIDHEYVEWGEWDGKRS